ncbi:3-hydroxyacyl-CoA dehydrogenase/enoyl-CoA hydratase family protein [Methylobacter sp.]|uniref:3-hydroxyacyl-CoA dehydrogenase/enoyl-CoA hydratase family protein n=1 Tax=Methylobacter sp. TaxID=2051955 RepID=UPI00248997F6|nr:3-hydroxyacyl-CoA dehydrogenase/enoyl-CoA hydratase family protein [Methylobacter sp.]MDI1276129.1 3-hydroxyacyl-CoA dehydrogenase/enoyl-CoA hydratase family protein [Methylobacter sp.]MDI1356801.1 3-hydroxyacyl-CoA dehydrogenase/enoyl-CoA hydratase family protein [Methylobacter sp.]
MDIKKVAVIGAGVMGAGIAAHIANAGIPVYLLDIVPKDAANRNSIAESAIAKLLKAEPAAFMHKNYARLVTPGNIEDHLDWVGDVDWVIEAVLENPAIKQELYRKLDNICRPDTLISSNTSTLPLKLLTRDMPDSFKQRFMITHFFNPPRYMRLLELVSGAATRPELVTAVSRFADTHLGKDSVTCKDTPGFIGNRIGIYWLQCGLLEAIKLGLTVEQADAVMSAPFGIPKTGIFGLLDLVGLDLIPHILGGMKLALPKEDAFHQVNTFPPLVQTMIAEGYTGRKGKGGFYRLNETSGKRVKESINLQTGGYQPSEKFALPVMPKTQDELRVFLSGDDALCRFAWQVLSNTLVYTASLIPEIADDIVAVDTAMCLGYNWKFGPFELLDKIGVAWFVDRLIAENRDVPPLLASRHSLYKVDSGKRSFVDLSGNYQTVRRTDGVLLLSDIKLSAPAVLENPSASLWDLGDGVACLEFHSKMNTLDMDSLALVRQSVEKVKTDFSALVIHNDADNFSAGANLTLLVQAIHNQDWPAVEQLIKQGQQTYQALKYAPFPVVGAPSGLALGGGCEILLHCDAIQAHAELYVGLVEVGVGLVPGWGGCKEYLRRWLEFARRPGGPMPGIAQAFETIGMAKVSKSAAEAKEMLFLSTTDGITMNKDRLLADAKAKALRLVPGYMPPKSSSYQLPGTSARAAMDIAINNLKMAGKITDYDVEISQQLADVLSGGQCDITEPLTEDDLLNLELNAFLHLVQQPGTLARLEHLLKTGKPLRN